MADDACQPPVALQGKLKETDKLIQAETSETGRVCQSKLVTCARDFFQYLHKQWYVICCWRDYYMEKCY